LTKRVLLTGKSGLLGGYLAEEFSHFELFGDRVDVRDASAVDACVERVQPDVVVHAAALSAAADCARDPAEARAVNVLGTANVARASARAGARLVHVSTDLVFDGEQAPYTETAAVSPLSVYGRTKADAELEALRAPASVVVRVSLLFGPQRTERRGFFDAQLVALRSGEPITLFDDEWRTPRSFRSAAAALAAVAGGTLTGIVHAGGPERMSRWEMGLRLARRLGIEAPPVTRLSRLSVGGEPRARDVSLDSALLARAHPELSRRSFEDELGAMGL
jgi:dTDP-4-dehydrorhamnose reductase